MLNHGFHFITSSLGALQIQQLSLSLCLLDNLILNQKKEKKKVLDNLFIYLFFNYL